MTDPTYLSAEVARRFPRTKTSRCPGCGRRLPTLDATDARHLDEWACSCGTTGFRRLDGYIVWTLGSAGSQGRAGRG